MTEITEEEYLAGELLSPIKHEYVAGQVYAMAGATLTHGVLVANLQFALHGHLRGKPCRSFVADMKVRQAKSPAYYYPDVVVTCDPRDLKREPPIYYLEHPSLIVEVLSATTQRTDRFDKLLAYRQLPSLVEYVLVDQARQHVEIYRRDGNGWLHEALGRGDTLDLTAVNLQMPMDAVYEDSGVPEQGDIGEEMK